MFDIFKRGSCIGSCRLRYLILYGRIVGDSGDMVQVDDSLDIDTNAILMKQLLMWFKISL